MSVFTQLTVVCLYHSSIHLLAASWFFVNKVQFKKSSLEQLSRASNVKLNSDESLQRACVCVCVCV